MTTSDYALAVAIVSIFISVLALCWNVWQKFIFVKPAIHVGFGIYSVLQRDSSGLMQRTGKRVLSLTVTNMGPGPVVLFSCIAKEKWPCWGKSRLGLLNPIHGDPTHPQPTSLGPFSASLPLRIDAGDTKTFYFPYSEDTFLKDDICRVGVNDTYHRNTWCSRSDVRKVNAAYRKDFGVS